jgi:hypothetical protein
MLLIAAAPALAQQGGPPPPAGRERLLGRQGPTIVAEPVAVTLAGFDADGDGLVTRAEVSAGAVRSFNAIANGAKDFGYIGYSQWALRWLGDANALPNPFDVDADHDNRITAAEINAALLAAFNRFDTNKDGTLTRAELITVRATVFGDEGQRGKKGKAPPPRQ